MPWAGLFGPVRAKKPQDLDRANAFGFFVAILFAILFLALGPAGVADDEPKEGQPPGGKPGPGGMQPPGMFGQRSGDLLPPEAVEKLKLSAEQKEKYAKISTEYQEKQNAAGEKVRETLQKDGGRVQEVMQKMRTDAERLRTEYLGKVETLLSAEQKNTFAEVKNQQRGMQLAGALGPFQRRGMPQEDPRLGTLIERPSPTLVEQLGLPRDQGMVLPEVKEGSAAAKAGLKAHDILLEVGGKPLPSDEQAFGKLVDEFKASTPLDAVVLRKGQKETIKGLTLPEADPKARERGRAGNFGLMPLRPAGARGIPGKPNAASGPTIERGPDGGFTTRYQEGDVTITLTGKIADGKTAISAIEIKVGSQTRKYQSVDQVADEFREDVKYLIRQTEKGK